MKVVLKCCAAFLLLLVAMWVFGIGRQQLLRWRAGRLLADIQSLRVSQSTWADAQRFMTRWKTWGVSYESCTAEQCDFRVQISDFIPREYGLDQFDYDGPKHFARALDRLGLRQAYVVASIRVFHGIVTRKDFAMAVARPVRLWQTPGGPFAMEIQADVSEGPHLRNNMNPDFYSGDFNSSVRRMPHGTLRVVSTPQEPLQRRRALMAFRLDCISQWFQCTKESQVLPLAAAEFAAMERAGQDSESMVRECSGHNLEFLARENDDVWIVTAEARAEPDLESKANGELEYRLFVRPVEVLKGKYPLVLSAALKTVRTSKEQPVIGKDRSARFFVFGEVGNFLPPPDRYFFQERACSLTPVTPENLDAVRRGVAEDYDPGAF